MITCLVICEVEQRLTNRLQTLRGQYCTFSVLGNPGKDRLRFNHRNFSPVMNNRFCANEVGCRTYVGIGMHLW